VSSSPTPAPVRASFQEPGCRNGVAASPALPGWLTGLLGRFAKAPAERVLEVEERLMVGGRKSVLLIACHGRRFLLASSGDAMTPLIEVLPQPQQSAPPTEKGSL
jgi:flagellar biogenesis protein FliO